MKQLSAMDAMFLYIESSHAPANIGGVSILDPSTAPGGVVRFKQLIKLMEERAHLAPYTQQRLLEVPFSADLPYWINDDSFNAEFHIRHIALPKPGDWRQLCIQLARLHARQLDRSRPLWELYVIEGLDNIEGIPSGSFAIYSKTHHSAVDGRSAADIGSALCDLSPESREVADTETWISDDDPSVLTMGINLLQNELAKPKNCLNLMKKSIPSIASTAKSIATGDMKVTLMKAPRTRFNHDVSPHRVFDAVTFSIDELREIRRSSNTTVNDIVLAISAGALRRYLESKDELPEESLIAMVPVNIRGNSQEKSDGGNVVSQMQLPLHTELADPKTRLTTIAEETVNSKKLLASIGGDMIGGITELVPTSIMSASLNLFVKKGLASKIKPRINIIITNVPGSPLPLYVCGAKVLASYGIGPVMDAAGLIHAVTSYNGQLSISVTSCREMMPDPSFYIECLQAAYSEIKTVYVDKKTTGTNKKPTANGVEKARSATKAKAVVSKPKTKVKKARANSIPKRSEEQ